MKAYKFKINGKEYNVAVNGIEGKNADVTVNGVNYQVELENEILAECDGTITAIHVKQGDSVLEGADIVTIG